eukprot:3144577-Prymnesium_polylepis.1
MRIGSHPFGQLMNRYLRHTASLVRHTTAISDSSELIDHSGYFSVDPITTHTLECPSVTLVRQGGELASVSN